MNTEIDSVTETLSAKTSCYGDTAILDFISNVQTETVESALAGTEYEDLPVISQASTFSRTAEFPAGDITIRDVAGLYVFDNTLGGVEINGAQLRDYLEYSARYFNQTEEGAAFDPETGTNAVDEASGAPIPDYNYDALAGGDYPVGDLKEVYNEQVEVRQALIDWVEDREVVDPKDFSDENWRVVTSTQDPGDDDARSDADAGDGADGGDSAHGGDSADGDDSAGGARSGADSDGTDDAESGTASATGSEDGAGSDSGTGDDGSGDSGGGGDLPRTGAEIATAIGLAVGTIAIGAALLIFARRRRI